MKATLRLYTFDKWGNEVHNDWTFTPLKDEDASEIYRESETAAGGEPRRRPYSEREIRKLTLGAGLLRQQDAWASFKRLLHAHKIEWQRTVGSATGGKTQWVEFALDAESKIEFERVNERTKLRRIAVTLVQVAATDFTHFEDTSVQLVGLRESE